MEIQKETCWHVYRKSVLVIDGKNNNDVGRFSGIVCMERATMKTQKNKLEKLRRRSEQYVEMRNLRRDSSFQKHRRSPSHQDSQRDQR
jgi:hypothetical protein